MVARVLCYLLGFRAEHILQSIEVGRVDGIVQDYDAVSMKVSVCQIRLWWPLRCQLRYGGAIRHSLRYDLRRGDANHPIFIGDLDVMNVLVVKTIAVGDILLLFCHPCLLGDGLCWGTGSLVYSMTRWLLLRPGLRWPIYRRVSSISILS